MSAAIIWILLVALALYTLWSGFQFRRGKPGYALSMYRNSGLPRAVRNWFLVAPITMALWLPPLLGSAFLLIDLPFGLDLPDRLGSLLGLGAASYFMLSIALVSVLLFRPPESLIPRWLKDDNVRVGYVPPPASAGDWFWLVGISVPAAYFSVETLAYALSRT